MTGTLINAAAIISGSLIGLLFHARLPDRFVKILFQAIGLFTLFIGVKMAMSTQNVLVLVLSIVFGGITGELLHLEEGIVKVSDRFKLIVKSKNSRFSEGLVGAFILFCIGSMTILGAIEEGMGNRPNLLLAKSLMDGVSSIALTSAMGIGVMFSVIPLLIYQGGLTFFAAFIQDHLSDPVINELTAAGGLLLIGLGINLLEIKKIKIVNMLPALVYAVVLALLFLV